MMSFKYNVLFLFGILVIGLLVASFFGFREGLSVNKDINNNVPKNISNTTGINPSSISGDNYNHFSGTSGSMVSGTFQSQTPNGGTIVANSDGTLTLTMSDGRAVVLAKNPKEGFDLPSDFKKSNADSGRFDTYYGPDGIIASIIYTDAGQQVITVDDPRTGTAMYTQNGAPLNPSDQSSASSGGDGQPYTSISSSDYIPNSNSYDYSGYLPPGIPGSQIPAGQEDLYILKSQVVPPVCPVCPSYSKSDSSSSSPEKCQPCPACARCPEPSFECKKVPNYNAVNNNYLPVPALADFSTFGM
jgi:hypothetical protein